MNRRGHARSDQESDQKGVRFGLKRPNEARVTI
jgi:hypothetical protein